MNHAVTQGWIGPLPSAHGIQYDGLPDDFVQRWMRWLEMGDDAFGTSNEFDDRTWRFIAKGGVFSQWAVSGAWRMSQDLSRTRNPLCVAACGVTADPADGWFEIQHQLLERSVSGLVDIHWLSRRVRSAAQPEHLRTYERGTVFWLDDWEVQELSFDTAQEFARNGLIGMFSGRGELAGA